jgi:molecular chaperone GrpE
MVRKKQAENTENEQAKKNETGEINNNNQKAAADTASNGAAAAEKPEATESQETAQPLTSSAEDKLAEAQDRYLRLSAEFDNYRKRTLREKIELSKYAGEELILRLLPVLDDFERAVMHMDTAADCKAMKDGIDLIYNKFSEFLKQNGIKEIEALNCQFNVDLHDAVAKVPVDDENRKGLIIDVVQKGYYLQDKIIRHSKVVVGE